MREIKTLEVDRWEPSEKPGMVKHVGMISPQEAFDALEAHLEKEGLMPDEYFLASRWDWKGLKELPNYRKAECSVNWGGSEGIYLDIELLYEDEKHEIQRLPFATGKTLGQSGDDYLRMSRIGAECSMMLNGRGETVRFNEEEKGISHERTSELLNILINELIEKEGLKPKPVIEELLELGFSAEELVKLNFSANEVNYLAIERDNEEKTSLTEKIEGASTRVQNGEKKENLPCRVLQEEKEL